MLGRPPGAPSTALPAELLVGAIPPHLVDGLREADAQRGGLPFLREDQVRRHLLDGGAHLPYLPLGPHRPQTEDGLTVEGTPHIPPDTVRSGGFPLSLEGEGRGEGPQFMESGLFLLELPRGHEPYLAGAPASAGLERGESHRLGASSDLIALRTLKPRKRGAPAERWLLPHRGLGSEAERAAEAFLPKPLEINKPTPRLPCK